MYALVYSQDYLFLEILIFIHFRLRSLAFATNMNRLRLTVILLPT
jgi:hypothetical protein